MTIIILGAGQVGVLTASILREAGETITGFVDDDPARTGETAGGLPILGTREMLLKDRDPTIRTCLGVGTIKARLSVAQWLADADLPTVNAIHPSVVMSPDAIVGTNITIGASSTFFGPLELGDGCYIGPSVTVSHDSRVGRFCLLSVGSVIGARVDMADRVFVGTASTLMEPRFGADARLEIGEDAVIGAGSLVMRAVPAGVTVVGRPAKPLEKRA